ncbi:MAG: glutamine--tRNA ligase/YqeY domain fusion protein [Myxococcota bacterium]
MAGAPRYIVRVDAPAPTDFIRSQIAADLRAGRNDGRVVTRFPPEPNGFLHIGHAKHIVLNFSVAEEFGGHCNLRFDDTNPLKEEQRYADAIMDDIRWLGYDWGSHLYHASDYFDELYRLAQHLIRDGKAYVCSLSEDEIRLYRGTVKSPGRPSPYRDRPVSESLDLFERMRRGEFPEGTHTVRANIDMAAANMKMRDPLMYRIRRVSHHKTGNKWNIYPMYDYAHPVSDALELITHSLCTLEFENNREIYDWFVENLPLPSRPRQIEYARLNIEYTMMSKRKLKALVDEAIVDGWDDPRMPTVAGLRRRGFTPSSIRAFSKRLGVAKANSTVEYGQLEFAIREELNRTAPRVMAVLDPVKVVITNYRDDRDEEIECENNPEDPDAGTRQVPFSQTIFIERDDFMEDPPKKWFRLAVGKEVRLKHAYFITCQEVRKDSTGRIVELRCTYDPASRGGEAPDGRKVRGTLHWVSARHGVPLQARLYDQLFTEKNPAAAEDFHSVLNPNSLVTMPHAVGEPSLQEAQAGQTYQFLRLGYFCRDSKDEGLCFNRTVGLKDTWAKLQKKG